MPGQLKPPVGSTDHAQGKSEASVTLVEYGDYQCPYCGQAYPIVKRIQKRLGSRLRFVFRNFPLAEAHPFAMGAAEMAESAALQDKFWQMHDSLYEHQNALEPERLVENAKHLHLDMVKLKMDFASPEVSKRVRSDFTSGVRSGVNGTPSFFINAFKFEGNWTDEDEFVAALEEAAQIR
jgi:protein-disulfide isomerase